MPPHPLWEFWSYFRDNAGAVAGLVVIVVLVLLALFADFVAPHSPILTNNTVFLKPPFWQEGGSLAYPLGTDAIGRDILSRLIHGARLSLLIGIAVVALSVAAGTILGLVAGFFRGVIEIAIMRLMDITLTLPSLLLAIVIVAILGPGLMNAMLAVAIVLLPHYVRIARAAVITEVSKDYVTAAKVAGAGRLRLMFKEVLPNCVAPLIVQATLGISTAILDAAALGFLGLGAQPPLPEWGTMLADAREFVLRAWWVVTLPGPRDPGHGARLQPARRRAARRARSEAEAVVMIAESHSVGPRASDEIPQPKGAHGAARDRNLSVEFPSRSGMLRAVDGVSITLDKGEVLGIVGESGSGKSVGMLAVMGLVPFPGRVHGRPAAVRGARPADRVGPRAARAHRQGRRDDLPGADDVAQSVLHHRLPARSRRCASMKAWTARRRGGA